MDGQGLRHAGRQRRRPAHPIASLPPLVSHPPRRPEIRSRVARRAALSRALLHGRRSACRLQAVRSCSDDHLRSRSDEPAKELLLMRTRMNARSVVLARARARHESAGAAMFIVAVTLGLLAAVGVYGLSATAMDVRAAGHMRESAQAQSAAEHALLLTAESFTPGT